MCGFSTYNAPTIPFSFHLPHAHLIAVILFCILLLAYIYTMPVYSSNCLSHKFKRLRRLVHSRQLGRMYINMQVKITQVCMYNTYSPYSPYTLYNYGIVGARTAHRETAKAILVRIVDFINYVGTCCYVINII